MGRPEALDDLPHEQLTAQAGDGAHIARLQYQGDATGALRLAQETVAGGAQDTSVRLAGACAAIEAGRLELAADLLAPLERAHRIPPRVRVLRHLIALRKARPSDPLLPDLATAGARTAAPTWERWPAAWPPWPWSSPGGEPAFFLAELDAQG